jgi:hypothetical protein
LFSVRFFLCLLLAPITLFAQPRSGKDSVLVKYGFEKELLTGNPSFLIDSTHPRSFPQIRMDSFSVTEQRFLQEMQHPDRAKRYWIKFSMENLSDSTLELHLFPGYAKYLYKTARAFQISRRC